ncbi:LacI family transcriptional regulator [Pleomorphomonas diazotrophica]|uniref:LacI family transcriptional regulator n=2 Tax=Pleomorphomonas diazotrophica TaxID=1166257 RepID=A0A1I4QI95_9HYPH|nr:LacI family DNA-binding transcriptional regulator [Pleomorphomonas diazotrophica]PKR90640.1 LacI family transcriptional regulator [Pleomorphomonas diazotrophica]SFM39757.1 transcriptional regulator, LacI family [Pleomorphomonas diazotrophica]
MADSVNIRDVAAMAGVSVATVSRTLKNPDLVRPETRETVLRCVAELGFVPNAQARHFRRQATDTVILLVRDISNPFYLDVFKGVEDVASSAGYKVLMGDARSDPARVHHYIDMVRERHADGLILMTGSMPVELADAGLPPMVVALEYLPTRKLPTVLIDNEGAGAKATQHLLDLGHTAIAHISGPVPEVMSVARVAGWRKALAEAGIPPDERLTVRGDFSLASGEAAVDELFARGLPFSAIFAANDEMAVGAINRLRARGASVPGDISVVGFDDTIFAVACNPPLTTVRQPQREIGVEVMRLMIERLEGRLAPDATVVMPTELILRSSTTVAKPDARMAAGQR